MTNAEYYLNEIKSLMFTFDDQHHIRLGVVDNKPVLCNTTKCSRCELHLFRSCRSAFLRWLFKEYKEPLILTFRQRLFCELMYTGYLVRNPSGNLHYFKIKPEKDKHGYWGSDTYDPSSTVVPKELIEFSFITRKDEDPWNIEDLVQLPFEDENNITS